MHPIEPKSNQIEIRATVHGEVQGVGFRATTRHLATLIGVCGTVRNCSDGTVEIIAQGSREQVDALVVRLKQSPGAGSVETIEVEYRALVQHFKGFQIVR